MAEAAKLREPKHEPRIIKISSKRQITIPADLFRDRGFREYALITETEEGFSVKPVDVKDEHVTVDLLRYLVEEGYEGEELIKQYEASIDYYLDLDKKIQEAEEDIKAGRVVSYDEFRRQVRDTYGI